MKIDETPMFLVNTVNAQLRNFWKNNPDIPKLELGAARERSLRRWFEHHITLHYDLRDERNNHLYFDLRWLTRGHNSEYFDHKERRIGARDLSEVQGISLEFHPIWFSVRIGWRHWTKGFNFHVRS